MANLIYTGDLQVFSAGALDLLASCRNVTLRANNESVDTSRVLQFGANRQTAKKRAELNFERLSPTAAAPTTQVVGSLDVSALTIDGTSYRAAMESCSMSGSFVTQDTPESGMFVWPQHTQKDYSMNGVFVLPYAAANMFRDMAAELISTDPGESLMVFVITIDGVTVTIPMHLDSFELSAPVAEFQKVNLQMSGKAPLTGAYPTGPTGTTTLLEKYLNAPNASLAGIFTNGVTGAASQGAKWSGNVIPGAFSFSVENQGLVRENYTLLSQGAYNIELAP